MRWTIAALLLPAFVSALTGEELRLERRPADSVFHLRPSYRVPGQRPFVLVLGGGAAKGLAHLGIFEGLEAEGLEEDFLAGTSAGALMGAFRVAGFGGEDLRWAFNRQDFGAAIFDSRRRATGLTLWEEEERESTALRFDKFPEGWEILPGGTTGRAATLVLTAHLIRADTLCEGDFARLRVPFACVASDLNQGRARTFTSGSLIQAVRASMSIPGVFRPVRMGTQQLVDGGISQNLPVLEAKHLHPEAFALAVDVSDPWEPGPVGNPFSLVGKSLAQSVEVMTRLNRDAAEILVRPDVSGVDMFDFHTQVDNLAGRGRQALELMLPALEKRLYGEEGERPLGVMTWEIVAGGTPELEALANACLPKGRTWTRRDAYRFLRRALAQDLMADGWLEWEPGAESKLRIHGQPLPSIRRIDWRVPEPWKGLAARLAPEFGLEIGRPFRESAWGRFRQRLLMMASLGGRPLLNWGTGGMDSAGTLTITLSEMPLGAVTVDPTGLRAAGQAAMARLLAPMVGKALDTESLGRSLRDADQALNLQNPEVRIQHSGEGASWNVLASASDVCRVQMNFAAAYESTWGLHGVVDAWVRDLAVKGNDWRFHGSFNRIQQACDLALRHTFQAHPANGWFAGIRGANQRFYGDPFLGYFGALVEPTIYQRMFADASQRSADAYAGVFHRFGAARKGLLEVEIQRREALLVPQVLPRFRNGEEALVLSTEWDSLDRHTFPTEGIVVRARGMVGRTRTTLETDPPFEGGRTQIRSLYLLFRGLAKDLAGPVGADLAVEAGLGWRTLSVSDRQYVLGGDASLIGTPSTRFLAPNFLLVRAGLPIALRRAFGGHVQVVPRLDWGRFAEKPTDLTAGMRVVGVGLSVRGAVGKLNLETGWGQVQIRPFGPGPLRKETQLNILIGARPFDLWMRK